MKRISALALALALVAGLAILAMGDEKEDYRGPAWGWGMMGSGMMGWGGGPGKMGGGMMGGGMMGPGMMGWSWSSEADLSKEQADKLAEIQLSTMRAIHGIMYGNRDRMIAMGNAMRAYPVDEKAATDQWKAMDQIHETMFKLQLSAVTQAQQVLGKEKWEEIVENSDRAGWGPGRGPGMMRKR